MGAGIGIFFIALGAILSFAVTDRISGVNLAMVGYICMGVGVLSLLLSLLQNSQRSRTEHHAVIEHRETGVPPVQQHVYPAQPVVDPNHPQVAPPVAPPAPGRDPRGY